MTRKTFPTVFDHSGLGTMNVIPYVTLPGATLTMEIVKVSSAAVAGLTTVPLFSRNVFTGPRFKFVTYNYSEKFKIVAF